MPRETLRDLPLAWLMGHARGRRVLSWWVTLRRADHAARMRAYRQTARGRASMRAASRRYRSTWKSRITRARWGRTPVGVRCYVRGGLNWVERTRRQAERWREEGFDVLPPGLVLGDGTGDAEVARRIAARVLGDALHALAKAPPLTWRPPHDPPLWYCERRLHTQAEEARAWLAGAQAPLSFDLCCAVLGLDVNAARRALAVPATRRRVLNAKGSL